MLCAHWCRRQDCPALSVCAWGLHSSLSALICCGKRESFWGGSCDEAHHCTMCCTGTSEQLPPLTAIPGLQGLGELNGAQFLWCKSKPALGGCATLWWELLCAGWLHGNYLGKIWHRVPQKTTLLLSFLSLECFEALEHRTSYSK